MSNETLYSGLSHNVLAATLGEYVLALADRNGLPAHGALKRVPWPVGNPSAAIKVPINGLMGYDAMAAVAEDTDPGNTTFSESSATLTVAQKSKIYEASDLARITAGGIFNPQSLAQDMVVSANHFLLSQTANLVDNFATTTGTSGVNAAVADLLEAKALLAIAKVTGPLLGLLHPRQWGDILADLATVSGGALQFLAGNEALLSQLQALGYQGNFLGLDIWTTTEIPTANAGADRAGGVFGLGAIGYAIAPPPETMGLPTLINIGDVQFEIVRGNGNADGMTRFKGSIWTGAVELIDAAGVSVITDA